jgi:hypothetical protein
MQTRYTRLLYAVLFIAGIGAGIVLGIFGANLQPIASPVVALQPLNVEHTQAMQANTSGPAAPSLTQSDSLAELVGGLIRDRNTQCPAADALTFEACLLFQGALGIWNTLGRQHHCPPTLDGPGPVAPSADSSDTLLRAEDALRAPSSPCFSYLYAIQVANATPVLVSTAGRVFQLFSGVPIAEPGSDAIACLQARQGICGNQTAVGLALFERAGFKARPLEFYYERKGVRLNHIIPEVLIGTQWHPVDTTYGAYWIRHAPGKPFALSTLGEILQQTSRTKLVHNRALLPYGIYSAVSRQEPFNYLTSNADIVRGGIGKVQLALRGQKGVETFADKPNFLGDNVADGANAGGLSYALDMEPGIYALTVNVTALAVTGNQPVQLCIDELCQALATGDQKIEFEVKRPKHVYVKSEVDVAYAVLASIEWKRED